MPVTKRGNSFEGAFSHGGKRFRKSLASRQEAENWVLRNKAAIVTGQPTDSTVTGSGSRTWGDLLEATYNRYWKDAKSESTLRRNGEAVVAYFGSNNPCADIMPEQIDSLILNFEGQGNSNATVNRKLAALSRMCSFGYERNWLSSMPKIERKREPLGRIRWLTYEEEDALVAKFRELERDDMADLIGVLVDTGLRVSEALNLEWRDLSKGMLTVWENKSDHPRSIPMTKRVKLIFDNRITKGFEKPFCMIKQASFNYVWVYVRGLLGLSKDDQFVPHALRHTCASRLVQAGVPLLDVKEVLGHKSIQMTMRYAHLAPQNLTDAISKLER